MRIQNSINKLNYYNNLINNGAYFPLLYTINGKTYINEQDIEFFIDSISKNVSSIQINNILQFFYKFLIENLNYKINKLQLVLVVDSNQVLKAISYTAKTGKNSFLELLLEHPVLKIIAPPQLFMEVTKHLKNFVNKKKNITINKLTSIWNKIENKISRMNPTSYEKSLIDKLQVRDKDDKPFISLFLYSKAQGILTSDKDIIEHPFTITTTSGKINKFTVTIDKGLIAFTFKDVIDVSLDFVMKIVGKFLFKFIHEGQKLLSDFLNLLTHFIKNKINSLDLSHIALMATSISSLIVIYLVNNDFKKSINNILSTISRDLRSFIDQVMDILENIKQRLFPLLEIILSLIFNGLIFYKYLNKRTNSLISILQGLRMIEQAKINIQNNTLFYH